MNVFYYPIILLENLDRVFVSLTSPFLDYLLAGLLVIGAAFAVIDALISRSKTKYKQLRRKTVLLFFVGWLSSVSICIFIPLVSIPLVVYLISFVYFSEMEDFEKKDLFCLLLILVCSVIISLLINAVYGNINT